MNYTISPSKFEDLGLVNQISIASLNEQNLVFRSKRIVEDAIGKGRFLILRDKNSKELGWIEIYQIYKDWWGISSLYVEPEYRGKGLSNLLLIKAVGVLRNKKVLLFSFTLPPQALKDLGFKEINKIKIPKIIWLNIFSKRFLNVFSLFKLVRISREYKLKSYFKAG